MDDTRGTPIDDAPLPSWARAHLSEEQLTVDPGLQWVSLLWQAVGLGAAATSVAQRLYIGTIGKRQKKAWPSVRLLSQQLEIQSQSTIVKALARLARAGWIIKEKRGPGRGAPGPGRAGTGYRLAWPARDVLTPLAGPQRCAQRTVRGGLCTRRAGYGTTTPGEGPCWRHGGERVPQPESSAELELQTPPMLQLLEHSGPRRPVDNRHSQPPLLTVMLQPLPQNAPTIGDGMLQPLTPNAPATGAEYVKSAIGGVRYPSNPTSPSRRAGVEGTAGGPASLGNDGLTLERAREILAGLPDRGAALLARAKVDAALSGHVGASPEQLLLAAARAAMRRPA